MSEEIKVSLICTVYNEEGTLRELLDSIVDQTRKPDEAVFVDGGSTDSTIEIIQEYAEKHEWISLIVEEGCNIAEGRNVAVENASHDYIVGTDGGCIVDEKWCESMVKAFEEGHRALSGIWHPCSESLFEFVQGEIRGHYIKSGDIPDTWAPSSRSIGFTREAWQEAGKYPEDLYTGEDAKFNSNMRRAGHEWHVVRDAVVYWRMRPTWKDYWKQFSQYGEGDARARNMFDYPGKILGVSKVALRTATTWTALIGLAGTVFTPYSITLTALGFGIQYTPKIGALKSSIKQKGLKTIPYWIVMIPFESIAHFTGYYRERIRNLGNFILERILIK